MIYKPSGSISLIHFKYLWVLNDYGFDVVGKKETRKMFKRIFEHEIKVAWGIGKST